jgi:hypothetical protein
MSDEQPVLYRDTSGSIVCPICNKQRPTYEDILAYKNAPEGSEIHTRVDEYNACCNPLCKGEWGTNCWHCHHPKFLETTSDDRVFQCAYLTRGEDPSPYWRRLLQLSSLRLSQAYMSCATRRDPEYTHNAWEMHCRWMALFRDSAIGERDAMMVRKPLEAEAATIQKCWLAVCKYCRASAETGKTMKTQHECVAAPLIVMFNDALAQLEKDA